MSHVRAVFVCITLSCLLAACSGRGNVVPSTTPPEETQSIASTLATQPLYVTSGANSGPIVTEYPITANGNVAPLRAIFDRTYASKYPDGVAVDSLGNVYVTFSSGCVVAVYSGSANGPSAPVRVISGFKTTMCYGPGTVDSVAVDKVNNVYVGNGYNTPVLVFRSGANGDVAPTGKFGMNTTAVQGLFVGATGKVYFADDGAHGDVQVYPANATSSTRAPQYISGGRGRNR